MKKLFTTIMVMAIMLSTICVKGDSYVDYNERVTRNYWVYTWDEFQGNYYQNDVVTKFVAVFENEDGQKFIIGFNTCDEFYPHIVDGRFENFNPVWCRVA